MSNEETAKTPLDEVILQWLRAIAIAQAEICRAQSVDAAEAAANRLETIADGEVSAARAMLVDLSRRLRGEVSAEVRREPDLL